VNHKKKENNFNIDARDKKPSLYYIFIQHVQYAMINKLVKRKRRKRRDD